MRARPQWSGWWSSYVSTTLGALTIALVVLFVRSGYEAFDTHSLIWRCTFDSPQLQGNSTFDVLLNRTSPTDFYGTVYTGKERLPVRGYVKRHAILPLRSVYVFRVRRGNEHIYAELSTPWLPWKTELRGSYKRFSRIDVGMSEANFATIEISFESAEAGTACCRSRDNEVFGETETDRASRCETVAPSGWVRTNGYSLSGSRP